MAGPSCKLAIKAIPNAPRSAVAGWLGDALKVKVHAPALEGRANDELCEFIADTLGLPRRTVTVAHGDKSRQKLLQIDGLTLDEVRRRLEAGASKS
ncbi:MAG TPA: DUF167 domain-containing protein [Rariglobus sp.]|jgi:uncharacterized protein (TIGR00251 family)|nr:DUF167 domain-containing protein [Rariglobus sp.]